MMFKIGDSVIMTEAFKQALWKKCQPFRHVGPWDPEDPSDCWGCSEGHIKEFGDSIGKVIEITKEADIVVEWTPHLRYHYLEGSLEKV